MSLTRNLLKVLVTLLIFTSFPLTYIYALEFKTEQEKGGWIKNFFKGKEIVMQYPMNATKKEKALEHQFIQDFINQRDIQHIEPIARGSSISAPEIAKYNTACPDKKPIDMYKEWYYLLNSDESEAEIEKTLEEPTDEYANVINIYRCHGNMKIYRLDINKDTEKEQYILYCDDERLVRSDGIWRDINRYGRTSASYLKFNPNKCIYSGQIFRHQPLWRDAVSGIIKYKSKYYYYSLYTFNYDVEGDISKIWIENVFLDDPKQYLFSAKTKGVKS